MMGGFGSGRRNQSGKATTNDFHALDIRHLKRKNLLRPGLFFSLDWKSNRQTLASAVVQMDADQLVLSYRHQSAGGEWCDKEYSVRLDWTPCNYGGRKIWLICPACARRVAVLYLGLSGSFACRHCCQLAYATQRETDGQRATRRADSIRKKLGWRPGIFTGSDGKPKGMHWKTFRRLQSQHDALVVVSLERMSKRLEIVNKRLGGLRDHLKVNS